MEWNSSKPKICTSQATLHNWLLCLFVFFAVEYLYRKESVIFNSKANKCWKTDTLLLSTLTWTNESLSNIIQWVGSLLTYFFFARKCMHSSVFVYEMNHGRWILYTDTYNILSKFQQQSLALLSYRQCLYYLNLCSNFSTLSQLNSLPNCVQQNYNIYIDCIKISN